METPSTSHLVNNEIYHALGNRWYTAEDDPVALLRAESRLRNPWILSELRARLGDSSAKVLDMGCGGGFLSNELGRHGYDVTGIDASEQSLAVAKLYDSTQGKVKYILGDATRLPFSDATFDCVCAMDFLEHITDPNAAIAEAARVLKPGGLFFFHTFNRNWFSWLVVIKGVEWFVRNTPPNLHILPLFIKPKELIHFCQSHGLEVSIIRGSEPRIFSWAFLQLLLKGTISAQFRFDFTSRPWTGYTGLAVRPIHKTAQ